MRYWRLGSTRELSFISGALRVGAAGRAAVRFQRNGAGASVSGACKSAAVSGSGLPQSLGWAPAGALHGVHPSFPVHRRTSHPQRRHGVCNLTAQRGRNGPPVDDLLVRAGRFLSSSQGQLVAWALLVWLVVTGRIGFIFDSFLVLFALLSVAPVVGVLAFRWWFANNVKEGACPNCNANVAGIVGRDFPCPSCGQRIEAERSGAFVFREPAGSATINVEAKEVREDND
ncbi:hypothetical protein CDCA_CDCA09G2773 [Cyanidium caldarium]|uniref:Zinc ribbon domain-containing protein n=1 Tax=Cyanidium caldarium TaxID=2771 RepID=A0AAV9IY73_CYACA|nr:hypothetical protein CDCA_CDCA09G2773 [Cyanidium caldarium]